MRHLWSSLAGLVAAPVVWVLIALGQGGSTRLAGDWDRAGTFDTKHLIAPAGYLLAAGVVLGLLATLRVSPAGPLVAGLLLAGPYAALFADPFRIRDAVPGDRKVFGETLRLTLPLDNGTVLLVGVLLLMAVFSAQRWRRWPAAVGAPAAGVAAGTGDEPTVPQPAVGEQPEEPARDRNGAEPASWARPGPSAPAGASPEAGSSGESGAGPSTGAGEQAPGGGSTPAESPWLAPPRTAQRERTGD